MRNIEARFEHVCCIQVVRRPVRISVQVNDIEIAFAIGLFGFTDDTQEFCHPVFAIHETCAFLLHLVCAEKRAVQNDARINSLHGAGVFDKACGILPCRERTGFFPFAIEFVADLPLLDVVLFDFVCVAHPGRGFLRGSSACVDANDGLSFLTIDKFWELVDVGHEFFEMPFDVGPVGARLVAVARGHREELVIVPGEQIVRTAIELHFSNLHAFRRQVGRLEAERYIASARCGELVLCFAASDLDGTPSL